jgi:trimeric autotransporter adhesin
VAYLKASNAEAGDHFGCGGELDGHAGMGAAISGDGNTLVVPAPHEASGARGINGNQHDETLHGSGAVYVFVRSGTGWVQQAYLKASNPGENDEFGHYVALSADGNTLAVSAYFEASAARGVDGDQNDDSIPQAGAVYVFTRSGTTWSQQAYIKSINTGEAGSGGNFGDGDQFGFSLALSDDGNTIAVGAIAEDSGGSGTTINTVQSDNSQISAGAVYVYARTGTKWAHQAYVKPSNPGGGDMFGYSVSLSADGNTLAVGSFDEDGAAREINGPEDNARNGAGAAYIFARSGTAWTQQAYLKNAIQEQADSFGVHVALSDDGNTVAVGVLDEDCLATGVNPPGCDNDYQADISTGAAFVFVRSGATWKQQAFFKASNTGSTDWYGSRLAISGDGNTLAIAASLEDSAAQGIGGRQDDNSADEAGAVYFYTRTGTTWTYHAYVKASNNEAFDEFGSGVALTRDGRTMVVTSRGEDSAATGVNGNEADNSADESGAVYIFAVTPGT